MDKLTDSGFNGSYRFAATSGIIAAALAANAELFQFRWSDAVQLAEVRRVRISASVSTTFFAAGVPLQFDLSKCTGWSGQGGGGTGFNLAALCKKRTTMQGTLVASGNIRIATTAGLTAGTKTIEGQAMGSVLAGGPITASLSPQIVPLTEIFSVDVANGDYPLILAQNEGFIIRAVAVPATGTWTFGVTVDWNERAAY